jgi:hypothetical protein
MMGRAGRGFPACGIKWIKGLAVPTSDRDQRTSPAAPDAAPARPQLDQLQAEVLTAVRGAISGVMADRGPATQLPDLDLDFSLPAMLEPRSLPTLRAVPEQAIARLERNGRTTHWVWALPAAFAVVAAGGVTAGLVMGSWKMDPPQASARAPVPAITASAAIPAVPVPTPPPPPAPDALSMANDLAGRGAILQARTVLETSAAGKPAAALLLARFYDPNFLSTLSNPDATADPVQARFWYRRWYDLAVKQGEVPGTMRLDLLLRSLDDAKAGVAGRP